MTDNYYTLKATAVLLYVVNQSADKMRDKTA